MNATDGKCNEQKQRIRSGYLALKNENKGILRARDAAERLGISEGELVNAHIGVSATRLADDLQAILKDVLALGEVMALTRNEDCVHERKGIYNNASFFSHGQMNMGILVNPDIDLRLFMNHWKFCFAVDEDGRKSLQFFDKSGQAIHKIYLTDQSSNEEYDRLIQKHRHSDQESLITIESPELKKIDRPDDDIDWQGLREEWKNLKDTHDFHPMLIKFKVGRHQALRRVGDDLAYQVNLNSARQVLDLACDKKCEIMVFVGNRGCIQIHTGMVQKLAEYGPWYNVLDDRFNLHLREDKIAHIWVTKKPTVDGIVTALEIFNQDDDLIVTFFGKRKPGIAELPLWREIIDEIPAQSSTNTT